MQRQLRNNRWFRGVIAAIVITVVMAVAIGVSAIRTSLVAEGNLQAFLHAQSSALEYIRQNDGQWPKSWDDLRAVCPESDFNWVAEHVTFDFDADPRSIAAQTPETFRAIVPNEPCYIIEDKVQVLIDVLAKHYGDTANATEHPNARQPE